MTSLPSRRSWLAAGALALASATAVAGLALPSTAQATPVAADPSAPDAVRTLDDPVAGLADLDLRGVAAPSSAQRRAATALRGVDVRWNAFGTPASILPDSGSLGRATSSDAVASARAWLRSRASLLGLSTAQVDRLRLVNEQLFAGSTRTSGPRAVLFRQRFGGLDAAAGGMVTVGVADGQVAYVSSSLVRADGDPAAPELTPQQAWLKAAADVGRAVPGADAADIVSSVTDGWTRLTVPGFAQEGMARLRALPLADGTVRPVFETNVLDSTGGDAFAYTVLVDAVSGKVLLRRNQVDHSNDAETFTGTITATDCGPRHAFELTDDLTRQIAAASTGVPSDDHVVKIFDPRGRLLVAGDLGTSPETATYTADKIPAGTYTAQVCPYASPTVPLVVGPYELTVTTSDTEPDGGAEAPSPRWRFFPSNPALDFRTSTTAGGTAIGCWIAGPGCTLSTGELRNVQAPGPWDTYPGGGVPTQTTTGNNANTREAWGSPLTPGGLNQAPVSASREYTDEFRDVWNNERCDPATLVPGGNDILPVVTSLFVNHNRMHDYSYYLGFTEANYNMQSDNLGRGGVAGDPEIGNAQAGALGGLQSGLGRDNANQITLQDGVPGVTNQYLFQPIAGAFYSPCTDGGLDMSIVGHEYTHAISNRMVGGPDEGLTSEHGGAMGESWSDLVAAEYMFGHGYSTGASPWVVGPYATGNSKAGIRDYAIDKNPLNFSDYGFDSTGDEVHADGEIWNGTMWEVRKALVAKHDKAFPYKNKALQRRCSEATATSSPLDASRCPGNRRWLQLMFDSFLLQQGATSMLDARDAMLAADTMRFRGKDRKVMWKAFAARGMGKKASTPSADSGETVPSFRTPGKGNRTVRFRTSGTGRLYVGHYEARATPVADTVRKTKLGSSAKFTPGRYRMLYVSPARGFHRFTMKVKKGKGAQTVRVRPAKNLAARAAGAKLIGATAGSRNPGSLIDGTEATNWGGVTEANVDRSRPFVAVDLAGKRAKKIRRLQVSAMLNPAPADPNEIPLAADPDSGSRFTALRQFAVERCLKRCATPSARWKRFYTSSADAFPSMRPRPTAPTLTMRSFKLRKATRAAALRLVVLENQCTGYAGYAGEQDDDPLNDTDCATASDRGTIVHVAELQAFAKRR